MNFIIILIVFHLLSDTFRALSLYTLILTETSLIYHHHPVLQLINPPPQPLQQQLSNRTSISQYIARHLVYLFILHLTIFYCFVTSQKNIITAVSKKVKLQAYRHKTCKGTKHVIIKLI